MHIGCFEMLFGITGHANTEVSFYAIDDVFFNVLSFIEGYNLLHQLRSIMVPFGVRGKELFIGGRIATQGQYIIDAEEVKIDQDILGFFIAKAAADQMGHGIDLIPVNDGSANTHRTGALAYFHAFEGTIDPFLKDLFGPVIGHIHERRLELHERIEHGKNGIDAFPLGRRQYFQGNNRPVRLLYVVRDFHKMRVKIGSGRLGKKRSRYFGQVSWRNTSNNRSST